MEEPSPPFTFIDLFAGIGGMRLPFENLNGKCLFSSEIDSFAKKTYQVNFNSYPSGDITTIKSYTIPDHTILLAGFPCQAFSIAGSRQGLKDPRGKLFFDIVRILKVKKPKAFLLENVKGLRSHNDGQTLKTMTTILTDNLGYKIKSYFLKATDFGIPQKRERLYIAGIHTKENPVWKYPEPLLTPTKVSDILQTQQELDVDFFKYKKDRFTFSDRYWQGTKRREAINIQKGRGFRYNLITPESPYTPTLTANYAKESSPILIDQSHLNKNPRRLTPRECARLQGFPENFHLTAVSQTQIVKQLGNSVCIPVVQQVAEALLKTLQCI